MYVATFYSFKGGVGRSMALVNVAALLARQGKRVLIVDFDLEAPGIDTFDITISPKGSKGVLDFIHAYLETSEVPDVRDYVYRSQTEFGEGQLWVMPAGLQDQTYHNRFRALDWADLYSQNNGFLLFEDLKAQWNKSLNVDYVLIDSRTGHTDVGGICTRQLPDSVVIFFYPNEQNRLGLTTVVTQIRGEASGPLKKEVDLHFVISNVPDIDDEDYILESEIDRFRRSLNFDQPSAVIHHYYSLALLDQETFTVKRPRSRLAREYAKLSTAIVSKNLKDRNGALLFLDHVTRKQVSTSIPDLEEQLRDIRMSHAEDAEVLLEIAGVRVLQRKREEALAILNQAYKISTSRVDLLLRRAQLSIGAGQKERTVADLKEILGNELASGIELSIVLRMLRDIQPDLVQTIARSPALGKIEYDLDLIRELEYSSETQGIAVNLLWRWLTDVKDEKARLALGNELMCCLIGVGRYREAFGLLSEERVNQIQQDVIDSIAELFNHAVAKWSVENVPPVEYFRLVAGCSGQIRESPNSVQCMALACYLTGDFDAATILIEKARKLIVASGAASFSCWSYLMVSVERFICDLEEMSSAFREGRVVPEFMRRNSVECNPSLTAIN